ncbi:MAG: divergent PAP2 family protein [Patescibacteria group bacterium]
MNIVVVSIVAVAVTQVIKTVWFYSRSNSHAISFSWPAFWLGGFPSSHTAALTSALYTIWKYDGTNLLFGFGAIISLLILYGLLEDKKRQVLFNEYFVQSKDSSLQRIVAEERLLAFSGHSFFEILIGGIIGIAVAMFMTAYFV